MTSEILKLWSQHRNTSLSKQFMDTLDLAKMFSKTTMQYALKTHTPIMALRSPWYKRWWLFCFFYEEEDAWAKIGFGQCHLPRLFEGEHNTFWNELLNGPTTKVGNR